MSTIFELKSESPVGPPCDQAEADSHRRAECAERISRLLSALDGGPSLQAGKTGNVPKAVIRETKTSPDSETSRRFLLVDRTGPIAEFGSWEDAHQYKNDLQHSGASIIGVEKKPLEPGAVREQPTNQPAGITGGVRIDISKKGLALLKQQTTLKTVASAVAHDGRGKVRTTTGRVKLELAG